MYKIYQVQNGETLESISNKLGIDPNIILELNGLSSSNIMPGTYLVVPKGEEMFTKYIVKKGDNMYEIAKRFNVNPNQLLKLNGLNQDDIIYPNQEILVPSKNYNFYVTSEGDTLKKVISNLGTSANALADENETILLVPDQLIVIKKSQRLND